jgi:hypothetical protein
MRFSILRDFRMVVFESNASDIYEQDVGEDPFIFHSLANRHRTTGEIFVYNPLVDYVVVIRQAEAILEQLRSRRVLRSSIHGWISTNAMRSVVPLEPDPFRFGPDPEIEDDSGYLLFDDFPSEDLLGEESSDSEFDFDGMELDEDVAETEEADLKPAKITDDTERPQDLEI